MKSDLATAVIAAIIGVVGSYFVCNFFVGEPELIDVRTIDNTSVTSTVMEPNPELFNVDAQNPTVEVYIGECSEYDEDGECLYDIETIESGDE